MSDFLNENQFHRRRLFKAGLAGALSTVAAGAGPQNGLIYGKAKSCIFLWLGGGAAQIDTFDPKRQGDLKKKQPIDPYRLQFLELSFVNICPGQHDF
jgi:Protein of unknown function (DUF1501)